MSTNPNNRAIQSVIHSATPATVSIVLRVPQRMCMAYGNPAASFIPSSCGFHPVYQELALQRNPAGPCDHPAAGRDMEAGTRFSGAHASGASIRRCASSDAAPRDCPSGLALRPALHNEPVIPSPPAEVRETQEGEGSWPLLATASRWHRHTLSGEGIRVRDLGIRQVGAA